MVRLINAAILATIAAFALLGGAQAKGPLRVVISGGDLAAPITLDGTIDGREMYGDGLQMEPPLPYPQFIYTLDLYPEDAEATAAPETIYYYPAHDGLPAAFRTSYGFFAVADQFEALLTSLLSPEASSGSASPLWYAVPVLALGLVLAGGGLAARALRRRATPRLT
ncbi:MAG: hypothetical protein Q7T33_07000 [Dehalococcoidia bacterium]|nr:hypothetical protein [Dehalococcoidia bacterium]